MFSVPQQSAQGGLNFCPICNKSATKRCPTCQDVYYCSRDHQIEHWEQHRLKGCLPYKLKKDSNGKLYMFARRDIAVGEIVLQEKPLIVGPKELSVAVCLGCYSVLSVGQARKCRLCGWPFCSRLCMEGREHKPECHYTRFAQVKPCVKKFGVYNYKYRLITIARCLYQKIRNQPLWEKLLVMESTPQCRSSSFIHDRKIAVDFIMDFFKFHGMFTMKEIEHCWGIVKLNAQPLKRTYFGAPLLCGLYEHTQHLKHSCRPNCTQVFTKDYKMVVLAGMPIAKGDAISVSFVNAMWGTEQRRRHLAENLYFECYCERCSDAKDRETMFNAVKCDMADCPGYMLPETFLTALMERPGLVLNDTVWVCNNETCDHRRPGTDVREMIDELQEDLRNASKCPKSLELFVQRNASRVLHQNHFIITKARQQFISSTSDTIFETLDLKGLDLKLKFGYELLSLYETVSPADMCVRGSVLHDMHSAVAERGRRMRSELLDDSFCAGIEEAYDLISRACDLLQYQPEGDVYGGTIKELANNSKKTITALMKTLKDENESEKKIKLEAKIQKRISKPGNLKSNEESDEDSENELDENIKRLVTGECCKDIKIQAKQQEDNKQQSNLIEVSDEKSEYSEEEQSKEYEKKLQETEYNSLNKNYLNEVHHENVEEKKSKICKRIMDAVERTKLTQEEEMKALENTEKKISDTKEAETSQEEIKDVKKSRKEAKLQRKKENKEKRASEIDKQGYEDLSSLVKQINAQVIINENKINTEQEIEKEDAIETINDEKNKLRKLKKKARKQRQKEKSMRDKGESKQEMKDNKAREKKESNILENNYASLTKFEVNEGKEVNLLELREKKEKEETEDRNVKDVNTKNMKKQAKKQRNKKESSKKKEEKNKDLH